MDLENIGKGMSEEMSNGQENLDDALTLDKDPLSKNSNISRRTTVKEEAESKILISEKTVEAIKTGNSGGFPQFRLTADERETMKTGSPSMGKLDNSEKCAHNGMISHQRTGGTVEFQCLKNGCTKSFASKAHAYKHVNLYHGKAAMLKRYNELLRFTQILPGEVSLQGKCKLCDKDVFNGFFCFCMFSTSSGMKM